MDTSSPQQQNTHSNADIKAAIKNVIAEFDASVENLNSEWESTTDDFKRYEFDANKSADTLAASVKKFEQEKGEASEKAVLELINSEVGDKNE